MAKVKKKSAAGSEERVTVRANDKVVKKNGAYHDPTQDPADSRKKLNPESIGEKPVEVVRTPFVDQRLKSGDLVEVRGKKDEEK